jgi:hypothetical protein
MREKAAAVGESIRAENGTRSAVEFFYGQLGLAWQKATAKVCIAFSSIICKDTAHE